MVKKKTAKKVVKKDHPYELGKAYFIRTVTMYYTGRLVFVGSQEIMLEDAAWVSHTGNYNHALKTGILRSVEPIIGNPILGRGAICECSPWNHKLPDTVI